jgi:hypothetical protein
VGPQRSARVISLAVLAAFLAALVAFGAVQPSPAGAERLTAPRKAPARSALSAKTSAAARPRRAVPAPRVGAATKAPRPPAPDTSVPAPGAPASAPAADLATWPQPLTGRVLDAGRKPIAGASVVLDGVEFRTGQEGGFTIETPPPGASLIVKAPGFEKRVLPPTPAPLDIVLKEHVVKAAYLTYYGVSERKIRDRVLELVAQTELNAVVIDVKGDRGWIPWVTDVALAREAGAQGPVILKDVEGMLLDLRGRGIYTIARIVLFKDNVLAHHRPDLAIIDTRTGKPWTDNEKLAWVDPFREEVWAYNTAIAREAIRKGFDEVQFDYVRFPTDGRLSAARYAKPNTKETRLPAIAGFLERARREIGPTGGFVGADIFGYTAFNENDTDIGQRIEELAPHVDYLCPMVYPSGYHVGIPGTRNPMSNPYRVIHESIRLTRQRAAHTNVRIRPWLQDFRDYAFDRRYFGVAEIRAQIRGAQQGGSTGWMLWNPKNDYTGKALAPERSLAAR